MIIRGFVTFLLLASSSLVLAAPGDLDTSFGVGGVINTAPLSVQSVIQQTDGKLVAVGKIAGQLAVARYNSDGTLDTSFDVDGYATVSIPGYNGSSSHRVIQQFDGKLAILCDAWNNTSDFAKALLLRLNVNGSLDTDFGTNGMQIVSTPSGILNDGTWQSVGVVQQQSGKLVLAGSHNNGAFDQGFLIRYSDAGLLDPSFGTNGEKILSGVMRDMTQKSDGTLVTIGRKEILIDEYGYPILWNDSINQIGVDGVSISSSYTDYYGSFNAVAMQQDGRFVIAGAANEPGPDFVINRLNGDMTYDNSFDGDGRVQENITYNGTPMPANDVIVQSDGKIVGAASSTGGASVIRYTSTGVLDSSFGTGGIKEFLTGSGARQLLQQMDGKLLLSTYDKILRVVSGQKTKNSLDNDLDSDLLTRSSSLGTWTRYTIQNAAITGSGSMNAYTSSSVQYVAQLDANGDGDADILTRNTSTGAWYLHQVQSGAVTTTAPIYLYANLDQQFIGAGDFNNDGVDDVMLRSASAGYYTVFLLSNHAVSSTVYYNAWASSSSVPQGIGDFNGDGTDDLLVRRTSDNLYFVFKTTNGAVATSYCACNIWNNPDWTFQFAGDTNKDGTDDIVIRGTGASADGFWWNFRMNNFSSAQTTNLNTFKDKALVSFAASGDYNGDGYTDMLIRVNNGPVYVAKIVNGLVSGSTTLLSNLPSDQAVLK